MGYMWEASFPAGHTTDVRLWDPSKTLAIINPENGSFTCVGIAPSYGRRCRNPIRADNRSRIMATLNEISYLSPSDPMVMLQLQSIAGLALCVRNHQGQVGAVIMQWQRNIQLLSQRIREPKPSKRVQNIKLEDPSIQKFLNQFKAQIKREAMAELRGEFYSEKGKNREWQDPKYRSSKSRREEEKDDDDDDDDEEAEDYNEEAQQLERERERKRRERLAKKRQNEKLEKERLENERIEREEKQKQQREAKEKEEQRQREHAEKEKKERRERERREREAAANDRIRQQAQRKREERERAEQEKQKKIREEWDQRWVEYQAQWVKFRADSSAFKHKSFRDATPWPVKSGSYKDVKSSNVRDFFQNAVPKENMSSVLRRECLNWHPDRRNRWIRDAQLTDVDTMMVEMICCTLTNLLPRPK